MNQSAFRGSNGQTVRFHLSTSCTDCLCVSLPLFPSRPLFPFVSISLVGCLCLHLCLSGCLSLAPSLTSLSVEGEFVNNELGGGIMEGLRYLAVERVERISWISGGQYHLIPHGVATDEYSGW